MRFYTNIEHVKQLLTRLDIKVYNDTLNMLDKRWGKLQCFEIYTDCLLGYMLPKEVQLLEDMVNTGIVKEEAKLLESENLYI